MKSINRKEKRNKRIAQLRDGNPQRWSLQKLSDKFGISRQRCEQICQRYIDDYPSLMIKLKEMRTPKPIIDTCVICGDIFETLSLRRTCSSKCLILHNHAKRMALKSKKCTKCRRTKDISEFRVTGKRVRYGINMFTYVARCKQCQNEINSKRMMIWQKENPEKAAEYHRAYHARKRLKI